MKSILGLFGKTFSEQLRIQIETEELKQQRLLAGLECAELVGRKDAAEEIKKELEKSVKTWMSLRKKAGLI